MENKYANGKIYKIVDNGYNKCYIGSTYNSLSHRMSHHRDDFKRFLEGKIKKTSSYELFEEFGVENCKIELVENFPCLNRDELNAREGHWIRNTECVNKVHVGRTKKEYYETYKDQLYETKKKWIEANRETNNARKLKWAQQNKERINERAKANYQNKKDKLLEPMLCECGCYITKMGMKAHRLKSKHKKN